MRKWMLTAFVTTLIIATTAAGQASADDKQKPATAAPLVAVDDETDKAVLEKFCTHARSLSAKLTAEHFKAKEEPEMLCWLELKHMNMSLVAYELTGDIVHLQDFARALENLRASLAKGPDSFLGWYGKAIEPRRDPENPDTQTDDIQTSFRAVWVLSRFLEIVQGEERLQKEYGHLRQPLIDLMENHLVGKWHARGNWVDLGTDGGIYRMNNIRPPCNLISLPWEKLSICVDGLLALYRVTGNDDHMQRIVKIGTLFKRRLQLVDNHYQWYRWVPLGKWDIHPENPDKWATWIGRSPLAGWYNTEVGIAVAIYHHGVVFNRQDIDRFVANQVGVAWNGDAENPEFFNCEGKPSNRQGQRFLCPALAPFSQKLADFVFTGTLQKERLEKSDNDWHGGVLASDWLWDKYVMMPAAAGGKPMYAEHGQKFLAKPANRKLVEQLKFEVVAPGYQVPLLPSRMDPMPTIPQKAEEESPAK